MSAQRQEGESVLDWGERIVGEFLELAPVVQVRADAIRAGLRTKEDMMGKNFKGLRDDLSKRVGEDCLEQADDDAAAQNDAAQVEGLDEAVEHDSNHDIPYITAELIQRGVKIKRWGIGEDGDIFAGLGRAIVVSQDENNGLYDGDAGELRASVVGSDEYSNRRVAYELLNEDVESLYPVDDLDSVEIQV